jgi:lambda family phage portal protein
MNAAASYRGGVAHRLAESWGSSPLTRAGVSSDWTSIRYMRDRGRQAYRDNPVARTLVDTETDNVIGDGFNLTATTDDEDFNREAIDRWYEWLETADIRGMLTGAQLQRMIWQRSRVDGDMGVVLVSRGPESKLQLVPSEYIASPYGGGQQGVYEGIKLDSMLRPTTFYVASVDENGKATPVPISARDFVFLAHIDEPNQIRGCTAYRTIFDLLSHLDRYIDGVSLAAWMATVFGIVFKESNGANQYQNLGFATNSQGNQQRAITLENGMVKYVGSQDTVAQVDAKQPMQQTPDFIRAMLRQIGMPFDMPLEVIAKDMSTVNFASARIGLLGFYRSCRIRQAVMIERVMSRIYRWWISRAVNAGTFKTAAPQDLWRHQFLGNAWDYTDPVSEAQSDLLQISMRTKSPQMVIAERGRDEAQLARDFEEWESKYPKDMQVLSTLTRDMLANQQNQQPSPNQEPTEEP